MLRRSAKFYIRKGNELEETYLQNFFFALVLSLGFIAFLFASIKKIEIGVYKPSQKIKPVELKFVSITQLEEPPPPPKKLKMDIRIETGKSKASSKVSQSSKSTSSSSSSNLTSTQEISLPNVVENLPLPVSSDTNQIYEFFKVEVKPKPIKTVIPEYPEMAKRAGLEGSVVVSAIVDEEGNVISAEIINSTNPIFNEPALKAARNYKFSPAMMKDKKVKVRVVIPFVFRPQR